MPASWLLAPLSLLPLLPAPPCPPFPNGEPDDPPWGAFRGPNGCGVGASKELPNALSPDENVLWRAEIPSGYSSPVVASDLVIVTGTEGKKLFTVALDRFTGAERWRAEAPEFDGKGPGANSAAAPSPATDGERVYVIFHSFGLLAYDMQGKELWRKPLAPFNIPHGMSSSPVLAGDELILMVDQDLGAYLAALDKKTGEELWRVDRPTTTHGYSTPAVYRPEEGPAEIVVSGAFQVCGYSLADGKVLWWADGMSWQAKAVPVIDGELCYVHSYMAAPAEIGLPRFTQTWEELEAERDADGSGDISKDEWKDNEMMQMAWFIFDMNHDGVLDESDWEMMLRRNRAIGGLFAIRLGGRGDVTETHVEWKYDDRRGLPDVPSPLLHAGSLFLVKEGGLFTAIDPASGAVQKQGRVGEPDNYFSSPVGAAGKVVTASQGGQLSVITADKEWEVLSVNDLGEEIWATPAIADGQVIVRTSEALYCFGDAEG